MDADAPSAQGYRPLIPCNRTASLYSGSISSPESSWGLRLHAHVGQAGQGQVAPAAGEGREAAGGAGGLVELLPALAGVCSAVLSRPSA